MIRNLNGYKKSVKKLKICKSTKNREKIIKELRKYCDWRDSINDPIMFNLFVLIKDTTDFAEKIKVPYDILTEFQLDEWDYNLSIGSTSFYREKRACRRSHNQKCKL